MLEKPDIPEQLICSSVSLEYGLDIISLTFLPIGYDVNTVVYKIRSADGLPYFLKLRKGDFKQISVAVPQFLNSLSIPAIIPPLKTLDNKLFGKFQEYTLILYPFIGGKDGYQLKLADHHWIELGLTLKKVHTAHLPSHLIPLIPHETYPPEWRESVKQFQHLVEENNYADPVAEKLAVFMQNKQPEISQMVRRAEVLAQSLQQQAQELVLCHTDAHPGNFLIANNGSLYLVDWDTPIFALKERDLMFFGSGMSGDQPGGREQHLFYQGYGHAEINLTALVYYRYERIIQDIAEFCKQLLLTTAGGDDRQQAYSFLTSSFEPGGVVEAAMQSDQLLDGEERKT
jgi:spectinomycin phosphotransferase